MELVFTKSATAICGEERVTGIDDDRAEYRAAMMNSSFGTGAPAGR